MLKLSIPVILFAAVFSMSFIAATPADAQGTRCTVVKKDCKAYGAGCYRCTANDGSVGTVCAANWTENQRFAEARNRALRVCRGLPATPLRTPNTPT